MLHLDKACARTIYCTKRRFSIWLKGPRLAQVTYDKVRGIGRQNMGHREMVEKDDEVIDGDQIAALQVSVRFLLFIPN